MKIVIDFHYPYLTNVPISYPLKTPENVWFSGILRGHKMGTLDRNGTEIFVKKSSIKDV